MMRLAFTGPAKVDGIHLERKYLIALATSQGHIVQRKVDADTDFLVCNDDFAATRKTRKIQAHEGGKALRITPAEFLKRMNYSE